MVCEFFVLIRKCYRSKGMIVYGIGYLDVLIKVFFGVNFIYIWVVIEGDWFSFMFYGFKFFYFISIFYIFIIF